MAYHDSPMDAQAARDCILIEKEQREAELGEDSCAKSQSAISFPHE